VNAPDLVADIARRAAQLSPQLQAEVLDFVEFVGPAPSKDSRHGRLASRRLGAVPDFPDRVAQPLLSDAPTW